MQRYHHTANRTAHTFDDRLVISKNSWHALLEDPSGGDHIAQTYQDEAFLLEALSVYVRAGLQRGEGVVLILRKAHWMTLVAEIEASGISLPEAVESGQLRSFDAEETLAGLMKGGVPDHNAFRQMVGSVLGAMRRRYFRIRAFGEMVDLLWRDGHREAAIALEQLWNELSHTGPFALLCGYHVDTLDRASYGTAFQGVCRSHTHLIPARDYRRLDDAVSQASRELLDQPTVMMLESLAKKHRPHAEMPTGQAIIHWLSLNMPRTADKVLARTRALYSGA
jgi:hypothetical protein